MEKFKSYVGLALALLLGWLVLLPQSPYVMRENMTVTPFDRTVLSLMLQEQNAKFNLLRRVDAYVKRCPLGPDTTGANGCEVYMAAPGLSEMVGMLWEFESRDRGFADAVDEYFATDSQDPANDEQLEAIQKRAVATYPELMQSIRATYQFSIYSLHTVFIILLLLLVIFRKNVGEAVMWPITASLRLMKIAHKSV